MSTTVFYEFKSQPPPAFLCPLTKLLMEDPVVDREGISYEKAAIEKWLADHAVSPLTQRPLRLADLTCNRALRNAIDEYRNDSFTADPRLVAEPVDIPFDDIRSALHVATLSSAQEGYVRAVYSDPNIPSDFRPRIAIAICRWVATPAFRLRVYGEVAQYLSPAAPYEILGQLPNNVKKDAENAYIETLVRMPYLTRPLDIVNAAIQKFADLYPRPPHGNDSAIAAARARRF
jgi:hypothetical protein